ncbi:MAG: polysaccharide biosynthesis protein, partial [Acidimicrobiales bacterium]
HEAVQLVLQSAVMAEGGEIFMLNMGVPVNILELAERMVRLSGHVVGTEIAVRFVGVRPGEKLVEDLQDPDEHCHPTDHPSIIRLDRIPVPADRLADGVAELADMAARGMDDVAERLLVELTAYAPVSTVSAPDTPAMKQMT